VTKFFSLQILKNLTTETPQVAPLAQVFWNIFAGNTSRNAYWWQYPNHPYPRTKHFGTSV